MEAAPLAATSLGHAIVHHYVLLADVVALVLLCGIHLTVWIQLDTSKVEADPNAAGRLQSATSGGLTVAGILVPLTIIAISAETTKTTVPNGALIDFFAAIVWFFCSIVSGLLVLYLALYRKDILRSKTINIFAGFQLFFLLVGGFQLVWGVAALVQHFLT
jgi:hypothetical protein